jgi:hypothetical protein
MAGRTALFLAKISRHPATMGSRFFTAMFRIALGIVFILGASITTVHASEMAQSPSHVVAATAFEECANSCCGTALHNQECSTACSASIVGMSEMSPTIWRKYSRCRGVERSALAWVSRVAVPDLSPPRTI